jgi:hypothetical protein
MSESTKSQGEWRLSTSNIYDINTLMGLAGVGILIKLLFSTNTTATGTSGPASATIWGYLTVCLALIGVLLVTIAFVNKEKKGSQQQTLKEIITNCAPVFFMIGVLAWLIGININYFTKINQGLVASEFYRYSTTSTFFIIFQLIVVFKYLHDKVQGNKHEGQTNNTLEEIGRLFIKQLTAISYILGIINIVVAGVLQIIVQYFSTDG